MGHSELKMRHLSRNRLKFQNFLHRILEMKCVSKSRCVFYKLPQEIVEKDLHKVTG